MFLRSAISATGCWVGISIYQLIKAAFATESLPDVQVALMSLGGGLALLSLVFFVAWRSDQ